jgi:hypothetical protein
MGQPLQRGKGRKRGRKRRWKGRGKEGKVQRKKCNIIYYTIHHISLEEVNVTNPYLQRNYYLKGH